MQNNDCNAQIQQLANTTYKNYYNDEKNLHVYKFDREISKTANEITKMSRTVKKVLSSLQNASFLVLPKFLNVRKS